MKSMEEIMRQEARLPTIEEFACALESAIHSSPEVRDEWEKMLATRSERMREYCQNKSVLEILQILSHITSDPLRNTRIRFSHLLWVAGRQPIYLLPDQRSREEAR